MAFYDNVDSVKKFRLGTRIKDVAANEYVYLKGVASTAVGSWVCFDEAHLTTRMVSATIGRVAIARAAVVADKYGWYLIYGTGTGLALTGFADNGVVQATSTDGSVDDAALTAAETQVFGAWGRSAVNETTLLATFEVSYPYKSAATLD